MSGRDISTMRKFVPYMSALFLFFFYLIEQFEIPLTELSKVLRLNCLSVQPKHFDSIANGIQMMKTENKFLLGPLTEDASRICLEKKTIELRNLAGKLKSIRRHSAYYLLRLSVTTPRLIFFLRGAPMWQNSTGLLHYDETMKNSMESLFNIKFTELTWIESFLPIKKGGIAIRHATDIAVPCFLSSVYNVPDLLNRTL